MKLYHISILGRKIEVEEHEVTKETETWHTSIIDGIDALIQVNQAKIDNCQAQVELLKEKRMEIEKEAEI